MLIVAGNVTIGVLSIQGSVTEHLNCLRKIAHVTAVAVKYAHIIPQLDGLIIPGGESTAIGLMLKEFNLIEPIKNMAKAGKPIWGTCAGMILIAKHIVGEEAYIPLMDIKVRRNAYGSQQDSFIAQQIVDEVSSAHLPLIFIRAPWIESVKANVKILCKVDERIVAARQNNLVVTSFHPELSNDLSFHSYFCELTRHA